MNENNEQMLFKEELFKKIKDMEQNFLTLLQTRDTEYNKQISDIKDKLTNVFEKNKILVENITMQKLDHDKIIDLEIFKNKTDSILISHEIRLKNNYDDINKFQGKYDKIIIDNLLVPGFLGPSCQFRNLGEFINYNMSEMMKFKSENERTKRESQNIKSKLDKIMKQMILLNDATIGRCTEYIDKKEKDLETKLDGKISYFNDKINDIRISLSLFKNQVEEQNKKFKSDIIKAFNMKNELTAFIERKEDEILKNMYNIHKKVVFNIQDIGILKKKMNELINQINELSESIEENSNSELNELENRVKRLEYLYNKYGKNNFLNRKDILNNFSYKKQNYYKNKEDKETKNDINSISSIPESYRNRYHSDIKENKYEKISIIYSPKKNIISENKDIENKKTASNFYKNKFTNIYLTEKKTNNEIKKKVAKNLEINLDFNEKIPNSQFISKYKNYMAKSHDKKIYLNPKKNNTNKSDSLYNYYLTEPNFMSMIQEPTILDQKILSDDDIKIKKEKRNLKSEIEKKRIIKNNLENLRLFSGNSPLDLYNYSTSIQKINSNLNNNTEKLKPKKKVKKIKKIEEIKTKMDDIIGRRNSLKNQTLNLYNSKKININNYKLVNLELDENSSINPDTNNGAYVIANKLKENNNISKLNITPTSYVKILNVGKGKSTTRLMNITFDIDELPKRRKSFIRTITFDNNKNKNDLKNKFSVTSKNVGFFKGLDFNSNFS